MVYHGGGRVVPLPCTCSSKHFSFLGKAWSTLILSSTGWSLQAFLLFSSRWRYSTRFWFLLPALSPAVTACTFHPSLPLPEVPQVPFCVYSCAAAGVTAVVGGAARVPGMVGTSVASGVAWVAGASTMVGSGWGWGRSQGHVQAQDRKSVV